MWYIMAGAGHPEAEITGINQWCRHGSRQERDLSSFLQSAITAQPVLLQVHPEDYPESYAVGTFEHGSGVQSASFSSRGASAIGGIIKPNIAAPGVMYPQQCCHKRLCFLCWW